MLIRASRRPAPSPQPALLSRHGAKPHLHTPPTRGLSSQPPRIPCWGPHGPTQRMSLCPSPVQARHSHTGTSSCTPHLGEPRGDRWEVRKTATPPVIPQPPATTASEIAGNPAAQQIFYWAGMKKPAHRTEKAESKTDSSREAKEGYAAPTPHEHQQPSPPVLEGAALWAHEVPG